MNMAVIDTEHIFGSYVTTFIVGISSIILLYWYATRNFNYWKKKGIPQLKPYPFIGSTFDQFRMPLHQLLLKRHKELGPLYSHYEGSRLALTVADPALFRDIFVKDFHNFSYRRDAGDEDSIFGRMVNNLKGDDWKRVRSIITPTFTSGKIKRMFRIFEDSAETLVQNFKNLSKAGKPVDCKKLFGAFSMDVIASYAFSTKIDSHNDPDNEFVRKATGFFTPKLLSWRFIGFLLIPRILKWFKVSFLNPAAMEFFKIVTLRIIEERKKTGKGRNDFLQLLLDTAKEVSVEEDSKQHNKDSEDITSIYDDQNANKHIFKNVNSKSLSMDELIAQCVVFFLAGHDTTASTLSFVGYFLALNQDVQDKLRAEIDEVFQNTQGQLTYEAVQSMKYLDNVIAEALRMFPPLVRLDRTSINNYKLGNTGITLPKGTVVTVPICTLHMDPKYFPEPEKFNPDRFTPEERAKRDPYVYLPFGCGPRNCVGMRFALMEMKVCIAHLIRHVKLKRSAHTTVPIEFHVSLALIKAKDVIVDAEIRNDIG